MKRPAIAPEGTTHSDQTNNALATDAKSMRAHALALHAEIRAHIRHVLELAQRVKNADGSATAGLTKGMQELAYAVRRHIVAEQRDAAALLSKLDAWHEQRLALLSTDHEAELAAVFNIEYYGSHVAMAEEAAAIGSEILAALRHEEDAVLTEQFAAPPAPSAPRQATRKARRRSQSA